MAHVQPRQLARERDLSGSRSLEAGRARAVVAVRRAHTLPGSYQLPIDICRVTLGFRPEYALTLSRCCEFDMRKANRSNASEWLQYPADSSARYSDASP
jgi:hypothetical protein